jgi:hypothetical protein
MLSTIMQIAPHTVASCCLLANIGRPKKVAHVVLDSHAMVAQCCSALFHSHALFMALSALTQSLGTQCIRVTTVCGGGVFHPEPPRTCCVHTTTATD